METKWSSHIFYAFRSTNRLFLRTAVWLVEIRWLEEIVTVKMAHRKNIGSTFTTAVIDFPSNMASITGGNIHISHFRVNSVNWSCANHTFHMHCHVKWLTSDIFFYRIYSDLTLYVYKVVYKWKRQNNCRIHWDACPRLWICITNSVVIGSNIRWSNHIWLSENRSVVNLHLVFHHKLSNCKLKNRMGLQR